MLLFSKRVSKRALTHALEANARSPEHQKKLLRLVAPAGCPEVHAILRFGAAATVRFGFEVQRRLFLFCVTIIQSGYY